MNTQTTSTDGRPVLALEPYADPAPLPSNMRLTKESELSGHTIAALITNPSGPAVTYSNSDFVVIVTATRCWLVLEAECDDDSAHMSVRGATYDKASLNDYVSAHDMLMAGLIHQCQYEAARAQEAEKVKEAQRLKDIERAASLRRELALLEATAK